MDTSDILSEATALYSEQKAVLEYKINNLNQDKSRADAQIADFQAQLDAINQKIAVLSDPDQLQAIKDVQAAKAQANVQPQ